MSEHKDLILELVSLWAHRKEPSGHVPRRAMHLAEKAALDSAVPTAIRSIAWTVVEDVYQTLGWELPSSPGLGVCHSAAVSATQAAHMLLNQVRSVLATIAGRPMILGELGLASAMLGRWDVIPPRGAVVVNIDDDDSPLSATNLIPTSGVHLAHAGRLTPALAENAVASDISGTPVSLPSAGLVISYSARSAADGDPAAGLLFSIAARHCTHEDLWDHALDAIRITGQGRHLTAAARRWGVTLPRSAPRSPLDTLGTIVSGLKKRIPIF
jgi:hypothetical protein